MQWWPTEAAAHTGKKKKAKKQEEEKGKREWKMVMSMMVMMVIIIMIMMGVDHSSRHQFEKGGGLCPVSRLDDDKDGFSVSLSHCLPILLLLGFTFLEPRVGGEFVFCVQWRVAFVMKGILSLVLKTFLHALHSSIDFFTYIYKCFQYFTLFLKIPHEKSSCFKNQGVDHIYFHEIKY